MHTLHKKVSIEATIVGRTIANPPRYDIQLSNGKIINDVAEHLLEVLIPSTPVSGESYAITEQVEYRIHRNKIQPIAMPHSIDI